jgi:hypothetical protein
VAVHHDLDRLLVLDTERAGELVQCSRVAGELVERLGQGL